MKRLILTLVLVLILMATVSTTTTQAGTVEEDCYVAAKLNWQAGWANIRCLFAMMAEIGGPGPDGMW